MITRKQKREIKYCEIEIVKNNRALQIGVLYYYI